jgi:hypothetical protein
VATVITAGGGVELQNRPARAAIMRDFRWACIKVLRFMQRIEDNNALIVSCDFCGTDWDGQFAAIEGHRGSIICLECLKLGLNALELPEEEFRCVLCLRDPLPATMRRWHHSNRPRTFACENCIHQAAEAFDKDPDIDWNWENKPAKK